MTAYLKKFGADYRNGKALFRLWAPSKRDIRLVLRGRGSIRMVRGSDGWLEAEVDCQPGDEYQYVVGETTIADPASHQQSGRVRGWSVVTDPKAFAWQNDDWRGRPWEETVIYELHPGLFGGFEGIRANLADLVGLGFTAIELMPIAQFPGSWNWGYDGVLPFAPDRSYGSPEELKALIDEAHRLGAMVFLDVVYNHFGPDGNFLPTSTPEFFRDDLHTPWGSAIDFRRPEVRQFYKENADTWIKEFRFDGLRFDAVHAMHDEGWLVEWAREIRRDLPDRHIHLMIENDDNVADFLREGFDAQWNDDIHHVLHVLLTGEKQAYYSDFAEEPGEKLARALREGFIYQGDRSGFRNGEARGTPSADLPPTSFIAFLQNHDQVGNRAFGERLISLCEPQPLEAAIALLLLAPHIPLVFMGEELGSAAPFHYFVDHHPELIEAIREGRRKEFEELVGAYAELPEPNAQETYQLSVPVHAAPNRRKWRKLYKDLLSLRAQYVIPGLKGARPEEVAAIGERAIKGEWRLSNGSVLTLISNLSPETLKHPVPAAEPVWGEATADVIPAWTTLAWVIPGGP